MDYISAGCQGVGRNRFAFISEGLPVEQHTVHRIDFEYSRATGIYTFSLLGENNIQRPLREAIPDVVFSTNASVFVLCARLSSGLSLLKGA